MVKDAEIKSVLIVDDVEGIRILLRNALAKYAKTTNIQIETYEACDGMEAFVQMATKSFDCVVTDLKMPKETGDQLIKKIQASELNYNTPVMVLSGHIENEYKSFTELYSHIRYLSKPCSPQEVAKKVITEIQLGKKDARVSLLLMNPFINAVTQ